MISHDYKQKRNCDNTNYYTANNRNADFFYPRKKPVSWGLAKPDNLTNPSHLWIRLGASTVQCGPKPASPAPASQIRGPGSAKADGPHGNALLRAGNTLGLFSLDI